MADVVPHDVADEEQGEEDPQRGEEQVEVVMILDILEDEALDAWMMNLRRAATSAIVTPMRRLRMRRK